MQFLLFRTPKKMKILEKSLQGIIQLLLFGYLLFNLLLKIQGSKKSIPVLSFFFDFEKLI